MLASLHFMESLSIDHVLLHLLLIFGTRLISLPVYISIMILLGGMILMPAVHPARIAKRLRRELEDMDTAFRLHCAQDLLLDQSFVTEAEIKIRRCVYFSSSYPSDPTQRLRHLVEEQESESELWKLTSKWTWGRVRGFVWLLLEAWKISAEVSYLHSLVLVCGPSESLGYTADFKLKFQKSVSSERRTQYTLSMQRRRTYTIRSSEGTFLPSCTGLLYMTGTK